jgi:hypothetical protein
VSERDEGFLARWSRRKIESRGADAAPAPEAVVPPIGATQVGTAPPAPMEAVPSAAPPVPPLESLTPHSDFAPFMRAGVDPVTKGEALKTLFSDPALYPMDGLDVYIDDYSQPDPLPQGWLEKLNQLATLHGEPAAAATPPTAAQPRTDEATPTEPGTAPRGDSSNGIPPIEETRTDGGPDG